MLHYSREMWTKIAFFLLFAFAVVQGFDISAKNNVVVYWGQNGGSLADFCTDAVDVVVVSFVTTFFGTGGLPEVNFAGSCSGSTFGGTDLLECPQIGQDIQTCQGKGKLVLLSLGGAIGSYGFSSTSQAQGFAETVWDLFGAGNSSTRPFGSAIVDGFDLDIENQQPNFYSDFITSLRSKFSSGSKQFYISGAPQCPFPDASLGQALDAAPFDMVFVQFYNNGPCNVGASGFNFATWQNWAASAPNPNVKVYVGVPGSTSAAGSGYVDPGTLASALSSVTSQSNFGGVMMWDANLAFANVGSDGNNYAQAAKSALGGGSNNQSPSNAPASTAAPGAATSTTQGSPAGTTPAARKAKVVKVRVTKTISEKTGQTSQVSEATSSTSSQSTTSCNVGEIDCINGEFAQCVDGVYVLTTCPSGTTCKKISAGQGNTVVTCDYIASPKPRRKLKRHGHGRKHILVRPENRAS